MIERLYAENFGCLKRVETPKMGAIHAFIGPNDSGKSTILRAVRAVLYCASNPVQREELAGLFPYANGEAKLRVHTRAGTYEVTWSRGNVLDRSDAGNDVPRNIMPATRGFGTPPRASTELQRELRTARLLRLDPDALRRRSGLIPDGGSVAFLNERGSGLPGIYDTIVNRGDDAFARIRDDVVRLFPAVRGLRLRAVTNSEKEIEVELRDGTRVPADQMSEGLLYYLAFAALPFVASTSAVLIEEPENGLHPARIADVMKTLRDFAKTGTQVLLATHSPLVVNELGPDEVSVVTRDPDRGTEIRLIKDTPNFEERAKVYALGELWVSYADGKDEAPLFSGPAKP